MSKRLILTFTLLLISFLVASISGHERYFDSTSDDLSGYPVTTESEFSLRYSSRDRAGNREVANHSHAWGDHVVLNSSYRGPSDGLSGTKLILIPAGGNEVNITSSNRTVFYDTYLLGRNVTANITMFAFFENGTKISVYYESVMLSNFFSPRPEVAISGTGFEKTISWTVADLNSDDIHIVDLYIKNQKNKRWYLLASNLVNSSFVLDMTFYCMGNWSIRLNVLDNDTKYHPSYIQSNEVWPALNGSVISDMFEAGTMALVGSIPGSNVSIHWYWYGRSFNYTEGNLGNKLTILKRVTFFDAKPDFSEGPYYIYRNGSLILSGEISYGYIDLNIDGLPAGIYNFTCVALQDSHVDTATIFVEVYPGLSTSNVLIFTSLVFTSVSIFALVYIYFRKKSD